MRVESREFWEHVLTVWLLRVLWQSSILLFVITMAESRVLLLLLLLLMSSGRLQAENNERNRVLSERNRVCL